MSKQVSVLSELRANAQDNRSKGEHTSGAYPRVLYRSQGWMQTVEELLLQVDFETEAITTTSNELVLEDAEDPLETNSTLSWLAAAEDVLLSGLEDDVLLNHRLSKVSIRPVEEHLPPLKASNYKGFSIWTCSTSHSNLSRQFPLRGFQIWVKGCPIAEVPDQALAVAIAEQFRLLAEVADINLSDLQTVVLPQGIAGQYKDRTLFTINLALADQLGRPAELIAIEWMNNLRITLGYLPIEVAEAQTRMYRLQPTGRTLGGKASWYGPYFHGRQTATGETFDQNELTAAHRDLPFGTFLKVTNRLNGKSVVVRVNDRGPYFEEHDRILDLSKRAAQCLGSEDNGIIPIDAVVLQPELTAMMAATPQASNEAM